VEPETLKGLVYLCLILFGGAAIVILVLALVAAARGRRIAELELINAGLAAQIEGVRLRVEKRSESDAEVLADVTSLLSDL
jgi:hypothetical protein